MTELEALMDDRDRLRSDIDRISKHIHGMPWMEGGKEIQNACNRALLESEKRERYFPITKDY